MTSVAAHAAVLFNSALSDRSAFALRALNSSTQLCVLSINWVGEVESSRVSSTALMSFRLINFIVIANRAFQCIPKAPTKLMIHHSATVMPRLRQGIAGGGNAQ